MNTLKPLGTAMFVQEMEAEIDLVERGRRAGLTVVTEEANHPKRATFGRVVALGTDPELHVLVKVGDIVHFTPHAGHHTYVEGVRFRVLYLSDVTAVEQQSHLEPKQEHSASAETPQSGSRSTPPNQSPN